MVCFSIEIVFVFAFATTVISCCLLAAKVDDEIFYQVVVQWIWHVCPICIALANIKQHYLSSLFICVELVEFFLGHGFVSVQAYVLPVCQM